MGSALRKVFKQEPVMILFFGLRGVGKTTLMYRLKLGEIGSVEPTEGFNFQHLAVNGTPTVMLEVVTRADSNEHFRHYASSADAVVFMVDSSDRGGLSEAVGDFFAYVSDRVQERQVPVLVLANKQDKSDAMSPEEIKDAIFQRGGAAFRENAVLEVFPAVALTFDGDDLALDWLTSHLALKMAHKKLSQKPAAILKNAYNGVLGLFSNKKASTKK